MPGLSAWAVRRPVLALVAWFVALAAIVGLGSTLGGELNDSFDLPESESMTAMTLLSDAGSDASSFGGGATIVWSPAEGTAVDEAVLAQVLPALQRIGDLDTIACVTNPVGASFGSGCPQGQAQEMPTPEQIAQMPAELQAAMAEAQQLGSTVSADGRVAYATVSFAGDGTEVSTDDAKAILDEVKALQSDDLRIGAQGTILEFVGQEPPSSEAVGLIVAGIILLLAFGSIIAAGMPIFVAVVGLGVGQMLVLLTANFLDVATFAPMLASMIGLGVGIDYALFVMNRYRQGLLHGHDPKRAAMEAVETAGRAVLFAGTTVIIALLGLWVLRINFFNGLSIAAAATVLMVMLSALWMLPALLSLLGTKALALRLPWGKRPGSLVGHPEGKRWAHYGRFLQKKPWLTGAVATGLVLILAIPMLSLRQGFSDDSGKPLGSPARTAFDLRAEGFGAGVNGPFLVAMKLPKAGDFESYAAVVTGLSQAEGVASTQPSVGMLPLVAANPAQFGLDGDVAMVVVVPTTGPQDEATTDLLHRLREDVNPPIEEATGAQLYVGGTQAITTDFTDMLAQALPLFLAIVVGLGFLALMLLFHSLLVPLTAAVTSLLSFAASMGITVAIFQWGWLNGLLQVPGTGPIFPFLPIMVFAILFGLSMDYQVFLVSRMHEEFVRTGDNLAAVRRGLAGSGRVVVIAAAIMGSVFAAFIPTTNSMIKLFGVALASAVLIDAFIVRLIIVPSFMSMVGKANWWLPAWLDKILPVVHIEPEDDEIADDEPQASSPHPVG